LGNVKRELLQVDAFLEELAGYVKETAVSAAPDQSKMVNHPLRWKTFKHLVMFIVTERFKGLGDIDNVVGGLDNAHPEAIQLDQAHVAELIVKTHNDVVAIMLNDLTKAQEALEAAGKLVTQWQRVANELSEDSRVGGGVYQMYNRCAEELSAALAVSDLGQKEMYGG